MATESFDDTFANLLKEDNATNAAGSTSINKPDVPNPPAPAPAPAPVVDPAAAPVVEAQAPAPAVEATGDEPASEIEGVEGAEGAEGVAATQGEPVPPVDPKSATDEALERLADMLAQRSTPQPQAQQPRVETPPAPTPPPFNQEETAFLTQYMSDFPDVAKAEGLLRRAEYQSLTAHIFREVAGYFAPKLALLEQLADGAAYSAVVQRIPKYDEMRDSVAAWVATQPAYLQGGMNHVIQQGTAEEIADLFDRFTQATGAAAPSATKDGIAPIPGQQQGRPAPSPALKSAPELSPAVKQAAARLAPVSGKRSAPTQAAPLDFNSAFDEFAKAG